MTEKLAEQLSALMDNECTDHEFALALRRLSKDSDMLAYWERCHLISDVLKGHAPDLITTGFSVRVADLIAQEPVPGRFAADSPADSSVSNHARPYWLKPAVGMALAASIAGVALLTIPSKPGEPQESVAQLQASPVNSTNAALAAESSEERDAMAEKLNAYLVNHNELATLNGMHGVLPYVKMVNYHASR